MDLEQVVGCHLYDKRVCVVVGRRLDSTTIGQLERSVVCATELADNVLLVGGREVLKRLAKFSSSQMQHRQLPAVWEDVIADIHRGSSSSASHRNFAIA